MRYKKIVMGAIGIIVLAAVLITISLCAHDHGKNKYTADLYFYNEQATAIESETRTVSYTDKKNLIEQIVRALIKGPDSPKRGRVIEANVNLLAVESIGTSDLIINFSKEFASGDEKKDILAVYSVVKSLCAVQGISSVKVVVDGTDITLSDGSIIGYLRDQDINLSTDTVSREVREVTLYFPSNSGNVLGREVRSIRVTDQQPLAQYLINELIKGPQSATLHSSLNKDTKIHSVETSNGICFVNFEANFLEKNTGSAEQEKLTIFSIVDSLTELENIDRVQFLIDGKRVDDFDNINISGPFGRNESMIEK